MKKQSLKSNKSERKETEWVEWTENSKVVDLNSNISVLILNVNRIL